MKNGLRTFALRFAVLLLASYGMLYAAQKFYDPVVAGHYDVYSYYKMYQAPLDFTATNAPFVYRQFSALVTHAIFAAGIYYPNETALNAPQIDPRLLFAALAANYLGLVMAATFAGAVTERETGGFAFPLLAGLLCLLSFFSQSIVVTGLTEGMTWFFFGAAYFLYVLEKRWALALVLAASIFQREMIPVVFALIAGFSLLVRSGGKTYNRFVLAASILCFGAYVLMRSYLVAAPGYESQLSFESLIRNLIFPSISLRTNLFQGFLSQNLLFIALAFGGALWARTQEAPKPLIVLTLTLFAVSVIVFAEAINGGIGRISSMLSPALAAFAATSLYKYERLGGTRQAA
jgi:hypothetical protein